MSELETNFISYSSRGGQNSDSDFHLLAWNFANNIIVIAKNPKVVVFSNWNVLQEWKNMLFGCKLKQKWIQGQLSQYNVKSWNLAQWKFPCMVIDGHFNQEKQWPYLASIAGCVRSFMLAKESSQISVFCSTKKFILIGVSVNPEYVRFEELTFLLFMANLWLSLTMDVAYIH